MRYLILLTLLLSTQLVHADSSFCDWFKKVFPESAGSCGGKKSGTPSGAGSTFTSSFNLNPASIPGEPSPYGLETIGSVIPYNGEWSPQFSIIKGFKKFGTGVSTASNNTFYGNDVLERTEGHPSISTFHTESAKGKFPNLNIGTSFPLNPEEKGKLSAMRLGVTARNNKITNSVGGGLGLYIGNEILSTGVGVTREKVSNSLPEMYFASFIFNLRLLIFDLEYDALRNYGGPYLPFIQIGTASTRLGPILLTAAIRRAYYVNDGTVSQPHYSFQYTLLKKLTLGFMYNYIPGTRSVALQIFL